MASNNKNNNLPNFYKYEGNQIGRSSETVSDLQYALALTLAEEGRVDECITVLLEKLCQYLNWPIAMLCIHHEDSVEIRCDAYWFSSRLRISQKLIKAIQTLLIKENQKLAKLNTDQKHPYYIRPISKARNEFVAHANKLHLENILIFPIFLKSNIIATLNFLIPTVETDLSTYFEEIIFYSAPYFLFSLKRKLVQHLETKHLSNHRAKNIMEKKLAYLAYHDELTGLANRAKLQNKLTEVITHDKDTQLALLFIDLDHFKQFNDTLGHLAGDKLLKLVAKRLKNSVRKKDFLARLGGDEFILIISDVKNTTTIEKISKKIITALSKSFIFQKQPYFLEVSIGISLYPIDGKDGRTLLKNADTALSLAKEKGGNNYQFCTPAMLDHKKEWIEMEHTLRKAIKQNELSLYYQPIFHIPSSTLYGFEALLRWKSKNKFISPDVFLPVAEKRNLILLIGKWVLHSACESLYQWKKKYSNLQFRVAVNISPKQLRKEINFLSQIKQILRKTKADPRFLSFEVIENSLMHDIESGASVIKEIKALGIKIGIDDFGTGYSSLNYIKYFSADILKIDRSFVSHIDDPHNRSIIKHIITMARSLNMKTIAEGIETKEQYDFLKKLKADMGQGYYLGKPMSMKEATALLQRADKKCKEKRLSS